MNDPILDLLKKLPATAMAPDRTHRTQARCHRALARRAARRSVPPPGRVTAWSRATVALALSYLVEAVRHTAGLFGVR